MLIITLRYSSISRMHPLSIRGAVSQFFFQQGSGQDTALVAGIRIGTDRSVPCSAKFNTPRARRHTPLDKDALSAHSRAMLQATQGIQMSAQSRLVAQGGRFATCFQSPPSALPDAMRAGEACERDQDYQTCVGPARHLQCE